MHRKIRDKNNRIVGYTIIDKNKKTILVKPEKLKEAIKSEQIKATNSNIIEAYKWKLN